MNGLGKLPKGHVLKSVEQTMIELHKDFHLYFAFLHLACIQKCRSLTLQRRGDSEEMLGEDPLLLPII